MLIDKDELEELGLIHTDKADQGSTFLILWQDPATPLVIPPACIEPFHSSPPRYRSTLPHGGRMGSGHTSKVFLILHPQFNPGHHNVGGQIRIFDGRNHHGVIPPINSSTEWPWYGFTLLLKRRYPHIPHIIVMHDHVVCCQESPPTSTVDERLD